MPRGSRLCPSLGRCLGGTAGAVRGAVSRAAFTRAVVTRGAAVWMAAAFPGAVLRTGLRKLVRHGWDTPADREAAGAELAPGQRRGDRQLRRRPVLQQRGHVDSVVQRE